MFSNSEDVQKLGFFFFELGAFKGTLLDLKILSEKNIQEKLIWGQF